MRYFETSKQQKNMETLTFEQALKRAEYAQRILSLDKGAHCVALVNGFFMAVQTHIAEDHKYRILAQTI